MRLADPLALTLLITVAAAPWLARARRGRVPRAHVTYPVTLFLGGVERVGRGRWTALPAVLRTAALALIVVALARPQVEGPRTEVPLRGRSIELTLDISSSMKALDFQRGSRLDVAKRVLSDFVMRRSGDFLGLVVFAGQALTQAPLTNDEAIVRELLMRADIGLLPDGTAIGTALAMGENHLKDLPRGSGVIVLLTDGGNNTGTPSPLTAAAAARALGIRIYTIGVSGRGAAVRAPDESGRPATMEAPTPLSTREERLLQEVASTSGGRYYRATDEQALITVLREVDGMERTDRRARDVVTYRELFGIPLLAALGLLVLELALRQTWLRRLP